MDLAGDGLFEGEDVRRSRVAALSGSMEGVGDDEFRCVTTSNVDVLCGLSSNAVEARLNLGFVEGLAVGAAESAEVLVVRAD